MRKVYSLAVWCAALMDLLLRVRKLIPMRRLNFRLADAIQELAR